MSPTLPPHYATLLQKSTDHGFDQPSEQAIGQLLKALVASKPGGNFLELGTGMGLSLTWMIAGMTPEAKLISLDNDEVLSGMVRAEINDSRVSIRCTDGDEWITDYTGPGFDLIFADTWPGKYRLLAETIALLKPGGFYVVDDMNEQPNWPDGHAEKADRLRVELAEFPGLTVATLGYSTGIILGVKQGSTGGESSLT